MSGIVTQFANSPLNKRMKRLTIGTTGTVTTLATGSTCLMWRAKTNGGNSGEIRLSTNSAGTNYFVLEAGDDTDWIPGNLQGYWYHGDTAADELYIWEME